MFLDQFRLTALHLACKKGHVEIVKLLISLGANVDVKDSQHRSPLFYAIMSESLVITKVRRSWEEQQ